MQIEFTDAVLFDGASTRVTKDGYVVGRARIARAGVQAYGGASVGRGDLEVVRVYRPEEEVFADAAMASLAHRPITLDHPDGFVSAQNWKDLAVGNTGGRVVRDGDFVALDLALMDQAAIEAVRSGKRQLSVGYSCTLDFTAGLTPAGEAYDAVQRNIRGNHLALVDVARAGPECRIGDRHFAPTLEQLAARLAEAECQLADARKALDAKAGELAALTRTHADEIAARDARLADAENNLDARIEERQAVIAAAQIIVDPPPVIKGRSIAEICRACVASALGEAAVKDRSDDYISASFEVLAAAARARRQTPHDDSLAHAVQMDVAHRQPVNVWDSAFASSSVAMKKDR
ncbi:DUF2213 domain-containing protein [Roseiarcaceae bacterium H3SJ34-1]|uniref:DUF2213 domain-containing protein n=1 Tax=Terripilifer ovatus TaxID=3032367 RepID=UPI003AB96D8E|nr:DUF2213 domain-containing protein [Roseiarcaceae bacterium H3SJ34-1]